LKIRPGDPDRPLTGPESIDGKFLGISALKALSFLHNMLAVRTYGFPQADDHPQAALRCAPHNQADAAANPVGKQACLRSRC
jgi:hypothetical protein